MDAHHAKCRRLRSFLITGGRRQPGSDYLDEDPEIPNQRYCIISFLGPEKVIQEKKRSSTSQEFVSWIGPTSGR
jgi:hypothetical protein